MTCVDCGGDMEPTLDAPLCPRCAEVAAHLGMSPEQRVTLVLDSCE